LGDAADRHKRHSMKTHQAAPEADMTLMRSVMRLYHAPLFEAEIRVALTITRAFDREDEPIPALKFAGSHAAALTRLISPRRKAHDPHDAEIEIDGFVWDTLSVTGQHALMDHELTHIQLKTNSDGIVLMDDQNRPKLKLAPDDFVITGILDVIRRHGTASLEWNSITRIHEAASEVHQAWLENGRATRAGALHEPEPVNV
jgi:hypothetical protein